MGQYRIIAAVLAGIYLFPCLASAEEVAGAINSSVSGVNQQQVPMIVFNLEKTRREAAHIYLDKHFPESMLSLRRYLPTVIAIETFLTQVYMTKKIANPGYKDDPNTVKEDFLNALETGYTMAGETSVTYPMGGGITTTMRNYQENYEENVQTTIAKVLHNQKKDHQLDTPARMALMTSAHRKYLDAHPEALNEDINLIKKSACQEGCQETELYKFFDRSNNRLTSDDLGFLENQNAIALNAIREKVYTAIQEYWNELPARDSSLRYVEFDPVIYTNLYNWLVTEVSIQTIQDSYRLNRLSPKIKIMAGQLISERAKAQLDKREELINAQASILLEDPEILFTGQMFRNKFTEAYKSQFEHRFSTSAMLEDSQTNKDRILAFNRLMRQQLITDYDYTVAQSLFSTVQNIYDERPNTDKRLINMATIHLMNAVNLEASFLAKVALLKSAGIPSEKALQQAKDERDQEITRMEERLRLGNELSRKDKQALDKRITLLKGSVQTQEALKYQGREHDSLLDRYGQLQGFQVIASGYKIQQSAQTDFRHEQIKAGLIRFAGEVIAIGVSTVVPTVYTTIQDKFKIGAEAAEKHFVQQAMENLYKELTTRFSADILQAKVRTTTDTILKGLVFQVPQLPNKPEYIAVEDKDLKILGDTKSIVFKEPDITLYLPKIEIKPPQPIKTAAATETKVVSDALLSASQARP